MLKRVQRVCHDTLPWLISFSLDVCVTLWLSRHEHRWNHIRSRETTSDTTSISPSSAELSDRSSANYGSVSRYSSRQKSHDRCLPLFNVGVYLLRGLGNPRVCHRILSWFFVWAANLFSPPVVVLCRHPEFPDCVPRVSHTRDKMLYS